MVSAWAEFIIPGRGGQVHRARRRPIHFTEAVDVHALSTLLEHFLKQCSSIDSRINQTPVRV
jgi:hypothetical protein